MPASQCSAALLQTSPIHGSVSTTNLTRSIQNTLARIQSCITSMLTTRRSISRIAREDGSTAKGWQDGVQSEKTSRGMDTERIRCVVCSIHPSRCPFCPGSKTRIYTSWSDTYNRGHWPSVLDLHPARKNKCAEGARRKSINTCGEVYVILSVGGSLAPLWAWHFQVCVEGSPERSTMSTPVSAQRCARNARVRRRA